MSVVLKSFLKRSKVTLGPVIFKVRSILLQVHLSLMQDLLEEVRYKHNDSNTVIIKTLGKYQRGQLQTSITRNQKYKNPKQSISKCNPKVIMINTDFPWECMGYLIRENLQMLCITLTDKGEIHALISTNANKTIRILGPPPLIIKKPSSKIKLVTVFTIPAGKMA